MEMRVMTVVMMVRLWVSMVVLRAGASAGLGAMFPSRGFTASLALLVAVRRSLSIALGNWDWFGSWKFNDFKVCPIRGVDLRKRSGAKVVVSADFVVTHSADRNVVSVADNPRMQRSRTVGKCGVDHITYGSKHMCHKIGQHIARCPGCFVRL